MKSKLFFGAGVSYILSFIFIGIGFHKLYVYKNPSSYLLKSVNAYVGGDAYNYIINANYATAFFTLAIFCAVIGITFIIFALLYREMKIQQNINDEID